MATTIKPVIYKTSETPGYLMGLRDNIKKQMGKDADLLLEYPVVYLHVWQSANDKLFHSNQCCSL